MKPPESDLERNLEAQLKVMQHYFPPRDPSRAAQGRAAFLAEAAAVAHSAHIPTPPVTRQRKTGRWWQNLGFSPALAAILVVVSVLVIFSGAVAAAAQGSLPGQPLYPLKTWGETALLSLARSPQERIQMEMRSASRRLQELSVANRVDPRWDEPLLSQYERCVDDALQSAANLDDAQLPGALAELQRGLEEHSVLAATTPQRIMERVQEQVRLRLQLVKSGLVDPQSYRQMLQQRQRGLPPGEAAPQVTPSPGSAAGGSAPTEVTQPTTPVGETPFPNATTSSVIPGSSTPSGNGLMAGRTSTPAAGGYGPGYGQTVSPSQHAGGNGAQNNNSPDEGKGKEHQNGASGGSDSGGGSGSGGNDGGGSDSGGSSGSGGNDGGGSDSGGGDGGGGNSGGGSGGSGGGG